MQGCIKFLTPPPPVGSFKSVVEEYQVVKMTESEYHGCGEENIVEKKGKWNQYHLPYNIKAVRKNIYYNIKAVRKNIYYLVRKTVGDGNFGEENQD